MTNFDRITLNAILRQDFEAFLHKVFLTLCPGQKFVREWHIAAIAYELERVRRGENLRLIINLAPRSLKSLMSSVAFPAFMLGHDSTRRIICTSYSGELAFKHANDFRTVITSHWYRSLFPGTRVGPYKDSESEIEFTGRGFRLATSTGGTLTGRGGDIIIIDDPLKAIDALSDSKRNSANDWFLHTLLSRLDDQRTGAIVIVMQRVHMDDLTGFVLRQSGEWVVLSLPAIAESYERIPLTRGMFHERQAGDLLSPERLPKEALEELRAQLGSDLFSAQFQQRPVPPGGLMIKRHWLRRYTEMPATTGGLIVQSWDTAAKGGPENDWSVCTTWVVLNCNFYLAHVWRGRVNYPTLKGMVQETASQWGAHQVLIEQVGTALGLLDELKYHVWGITGVKPQHDKITRMSIASALFEARQVYFPERAPWLAELEAELFAFPGCQFDDQVDSISQALNHTQSSPLWRWMKLARAFPPSPPAPWQSASSYVSPYTNVFSRVRW
jgi:predicted phage terminase large subunit-like protein